MNIFNVFKKKPKQESVPYVFEEIKPNIIEKMSEKPAATKFMNVDLEKPQGVHKIPPRITKMSDTSWAKSTETKSFGITGSTGPVGSKGQAGWTGSSGNSGNSSQWKNPFFPDNDRGFQSPSKIKNKILDDRVGIPIKISLNTIIDHPDLIFIGKSKIDGYPLYRYIGNNGKTLMERYPVEELFDASEYKKR
jgi:hypothetical protein